jgi:small subunit ribosomal protein S4
MLKRGPRHKICRRLGVPVCGRPNCPVEKRPYPPGEHGRGRRRETEYQVRLAEKQKLRAIYETRLDSIVLRLGFALSQRQARQIVSHGHVKVDGRRVDVPSARVRPGQRVELSERARTMIPVREALEVSPEPPAYLSRDTSAMAGTLERVPERGEIPLPVEINERLIVEHYS